MRGLGDRRHGRARSGADHTDALRSATEQAAGLRAAGDYGRARVLEEDTLARRRRSLGEDHPETLQSALGLMLSLDGLGELDQARTIGEDLLRAAAGCWAPTIA